MTSATLPPSTNVDGMTFDEWIDRVNGAIGKACGLSLSDLPDQNTWDAWHAGETPGEFAKNVLEAEGFYSDD